jgi:hypothetical protein
LIFLLNEQSVRTIPVPVHDIQQPVAVGVDESCASTSLVAIQQANVTSNIGELPSSVVCEQEIRTACKSSM